MLVLMYLNCYSLFTYFYRFFEDEKDVKKNFNLIFI